MTVTNMSAEMEPASSLSAISLPDMHSVKKEKAKNVAPKLDRGAAHFIECITKYFCILFMVESKTCTLIAPKREPESY